MAFTSRKRSPVVTVPTTADEASEDVVHDDGNEDATGGLEAGTRSGAPFLGMYDDEPSTLDAASFASATRHSRSKRSRELRRIDESLTTAEADASPAALHSLIHACTRYLGKGSKRDSKRRPAVEQLLQQTRTQMARMQFEAADRDARQNELRELGATSARDPAMDPRMRWPANWSSTIPASQLSLPGEGIHLKTNDGWIDPGWTNDRVRDGQRPIAPASMNEHYAGEDRWASHRAPEAFFRGQGFAGNIATSYLTDEQRSARRAQLGQVGGMIGSADGGLEDTRDSATGVRGLDKVEEASKIFAMSPAGELYLGDPDRDGQNVAPWAASVGQARAGVQQDWRAMDDVRFLHHSSFLAGGDVMSAGTMNIDSGRLHEITNSSGHYTPDKQTLVPALQTLRDGGVNVDLTDVGYVDPTTKQTVSLPRAGGTFLESGGNVELLRGRATMMSELRSKVRETAPAAQGQGQVELTDDNLLDIVGDRFNATAGQHNQLAPDEHLHLLQEQLVHDRTRGA